MTNDRDIVRGYSQDRQIYRHNSFSIRRNTSENYYSNRNCPEIISLFALTNKHLEVRRKQIYHSISNDTYDFQTINYPIQSPRATPISKFTLENIHAQETQTKLPKVTPRVASRTGNKFPTLTSSRITSNVDKKNSMPTIRTSVKPISSSINKSLPTKMPGVSIENKKKIQLRDHLHRQE